MRLGHRDVALALAYARLVSFWPSFQACEATLLVCLKHLKMQTSSLDVIIIIIFIVFLVLLSFETRQFMPEASRNAILLLSRSHH